MNNIGKLTTPSGDGASVEVTENMVNINSTKVNVNGIDLIDTLSSKFLVVDALPENPDPDTFYFIPESD